MWQVGPAGRARMRMASASQSSSMDTTARVWPLVSPFRHSVPREREWKCASPVASVAADGLGILPGDHQHAPVVGILHDGRHETVRTVAHGRSIEGPRGRSGIIRRSPP